MNSTRPLGITGVPSSGGSATAAPQDNEPDTLRSATCPMCQTSASSTVAAIEAGGSWRCTRCGQHWDAARLDAVAAYAVWTVDHDREARPAAPGHDVGASDGGAAVERPDGKP
jgi:ribosomal protein L37AE/L43A